MDSWMNCDRTPPITDCEDLVKWLDRLQSHCYNLYIFSITTVINKYYINKYYINKYYINKYYINKYYINKYYINKYYINKYYSYS